MKKLSEVYMETVIKPLEEEIQNLENELEKKPFITEQEKNLISKYDNLLYEKYNHLVEIIDEETEKQ